MIRMLLKEIYDLERQLGRRTYATGHSFDEWLQERGFRQSEVEETL